MSQRPPIPPFSYDDAVAKVRRAEDAWNKQEPEKVALAYSENSQWRNRNQFFQGREAIIQFLKNKWATELEYRLIKEIWAFAEDRIAVRFAYEWHNQDGQWFRSYGNENWRFDDHGLMLHRHASINDLKISEQERLFHWPSGIRPSDHPGLSDLKL